MRRKKNLIKFSWETWGLRKTFLSGAVQPLLQAFTQRNEATAQPTCLREWSQDCVEEGWERHILCHCKYRNAWRGSGKLLPLIPPGKPACASKVSEAQKACRTGLLVLVRLAKKKQEEVKETNCRLLETGRDHHHFVWHLCSRHHCNNLDNNWIFSTKLHY